jgi:hypothetical protein
METVLPSLLTFIMLIVSLLTIVMTSFSSINTISDSFQAMEKQAASIQGTAADVRYVEMRDGIIVLEIENQGQTNLEDYSAWSVLIQLANGQTSYLTYSVSPQSLGGNEWGADGFWLRDGVPEVFDLKILNPDEKMTILLKISPPLETSQIVRIIVATPNGNTTQCQIIVP